MKAALEHSPVACDYADWGEDRAVVYSSRTVESLDWRGIHALLESAEPEASLRGLAERVLVSLEILVPYDRAAFLVTQAERLKEARLLVHRGLDEGLLRQYWEHYIDLDPAFWLLPTAERFELDWHEYPEGEFRNDFVPRMGTPAVIGVSDIREGSVPGFALVLHRLGSKGFTEREKLTLSALAPYLHRLSSTLIQPGQVEPVSLRLSPREREIALLLAQRPSVAELAERFGISKKTVAKHLEGIYSALGVRGKREAALLLRSRSQGAPPPRLAGTAPGKLRSFD